MNVVLNVERGTRDPCGKSFYCPPSRVIVRAGLGVMQSCLIPLPGDQISMVVSKWRRKPVKACCVHKFPLWVCLHCIVGAGVHLHNVLVVKWISTVLATQRRHGIRNADLNGFVREVNHHAIHGIYDLNRAILGIPVQQLTVRRRRTLCPFIFE